ncbi:MAG: porin [Bacteroidales bacterium]|nr:porin [Bacteroidales bacterium]
MKKLLTMTMAVRKLALGLLLASAMVITLPAQDTAAVRSDLIPEIAGILKTKVEFDLDNSLMRFEVRNARFSVRGKINNYMTYKLEIDLSDEGQMKMLDAYVRFSPVTDLNFYLGQRKIPFSSDYMRSPADNIFANRSFLAKYINEGMRDIGFYAEYIFRGPIPVSVVAGAVNGTGNNNPQWINRPNFAARLSAGKDNGVRAATNLYYGEGAVEHNLSMFGAELRYNNGHFFIESEYIMRQWTDTLSAVQKDDGIYLHSYYNFMPVNRMVKMVTPVARIDFIGDSVFSGDIGASRFTCGLNLGFEAKQFYSEIRLNYENYFKSLLPIHTDKFTLEFIGRF